MPTRLADNDLIEVNIVCFMDGQMGLNKLHYVVSTSAGGGIFDSDAATERDSSIQAAYKALLANPATYVGVSVKRIKPVQNEPVTTRANFGGGTAGAQGMPKQVCGVIKKTTGLAGRTNRGRIYVPFVAAADADNNGHAVAGYVTRLQTLASLLVTPAAVVSGGRSAILSPVIYHRVAGTNTPWINTVSRNKLGTQRRRGEWGQANVIPF